MDKLKKFFKVVNANILSNEALREPQKYAYTSAYNYYNNDYQERESIIVMPTGTGKTGLIAMLPFGISEGRVLILTPQLTIKNGILENLTNGPNSFYIKHNVVEPVFSPEVAEYNKKVNQNIYDRCHIIVTNIQKQQERLDKSLIKGFSKDYFDLIIMDEAHHSSAKTWNDVIKHFSNAKVIKLTATPFRTDDVAITGNEIFNYPLSSAMTNKYTKSLENITYIPETLYLTIDKKSDKLYSIEDIKKLNLKEDDWISRSVAYSKECSLQIVKKSLELLKEKKIVSEIPHKIIAVACSVHHAEEIKKLYEENGCSSAILHSKMSDSEKIENFKKIENNKIEVVINVSMLGEGYDHKYLSIAAIFKPFRSILPYTQFIGRILRVIPESDISSDNIGRVISHDNLNLHTLWEYYRKEIEKSNITKELEEILDENKILDFSSYKKESKKKINEDKLGMVHEEGIGILKCDSYLNTEILEKAKKEREKDEENIKKLQEIMKCDDNSARDLYYAGKNSGQNNKLNRPDLIFINTKEMLDRRIKEEIIPNILVEKNYNIHEKNIGNSNLLRYNNFKYNYIVESGKNNGGILAIYINTCLIDKIGKKRGEWDEDDFESATIYLESLVTFIKESI